MRKNDLECVSSSADGTCIVWDLTRYSRNQILFAPTFFKGVVYTPDESQLLTCGTDKIVGYWEAFDGSLIRELETSQSDSLNSIDVSTNGKVFAVGGSDKVVKVYGYEEGEVESLGFGHSTEIAKVKLSGDGSVIASVSVDGAVLLWEGI
jgi:cilia- and flagella-associated protein 52